MNNFKRFSILALLVFGFTMMTICDRVCAYQQCEMSQIPQVVLNLSIEPTSLNATEAMAFPGLPAHMSVVPSLSSVGTDCDDKITKISHGYFKLNMPLSMYKNCLEKGSGKKAVTVVERKDSIVFGHQLFLKVFCDEGYGPQEFQNQITYPTFAVSRNLKNNGNGLDIQPQIIIIANDTAQTPLALSSCLKVDPTQLCLTSIPYGLRELYIPWKLLVDEKEGSAFQIDPTTAHIIKYGVEIETVTTGFTQVSKNLHRLVLSKPLNPGKYVINIDFLLSLLKDRVASRVNQMARADEVISTRGTMTFTFEIEENRNFLKRILDWIYEKLEELLGQFSF